MIDKTKHYFILMHPLENFYGLIYFTSSCTREKWVECEIVEDIYKVADGYKVTLQSVEQGYGRRSFYQEDFEKLLRDGYILEKTSDNQYVKEITWIEPLSSITYLKHSAYIVTE